MSQQALERIQKLCLAYMDAEETQLDEEANSDAMWEVVKQVAEIATVELAAMENKGPLDYMMKNVPKPQPPVQKGFA